MANEPDLAGIFEVRRAASDHDDLVVELDEYPWMKRSA
jgi:hypothetical protein